MKSALQLSAIMSAVVSGVMEQVPDFDVLTTESPTLSNDDLLDMAEGTREVNLEEVYQFSVETGVSIDYLVGRTDVFTIYPKDDGSSNVGA